MRRQLLEATRRKRTPANVPVTYEQYALATGNRPRRLFAAQAPIESHPLENSKTFGADEAGQLGKSGPEIVDLKGIAALSQAQNMKQFRGDFGVRCHQQGGIIAIRAGIRAKPFEIGSQVPAVVVHSIVHGKIRAIEDDHLVKVSGKIETRRHGERKRTPHPRVDLDEDPLASAWVLLEFDHSES